MRCRGDRARRRHAGGPATLRGLVLVLAYCAGLGVPFVLVALGDRWALGATRWLRQRIRAVQLIGGVLLVGLGVLLVTGLCGVGSVSWLCGLIAGYTLPL